MFRLELNRLSVEIAQPGEAPNNTCRFDRAGFITEVILDHVHRFCATEPSNLTHPSSGGRGLCNEFMFDVSHETAPGTYFPKLGIGLLKKKEKLNYCFYEQYEQQSFNIDCKQKLNSVTFLTRAINCNGYAVEQVKTITINENRLILDILIKNIGPNILHSTEYCHNFLSIDGMAIGPGYQIELPFVTCRKGETYPGTIIGTDYGFSFSSFNPHSAMVFILENEIIDVDYYTWKLINNDAKLSVTVDESFKPEHIALWACDHIVSVETFHEFFLLSGQADHWRRAYKFDNV